MLVIIYCFLLYLKLQLFFHLARIEDKCEVKVRTIKFLNRVHDIMRVRLSNTRQKLNQRICGVTKLKFEEVYLLVVNCYMLFAFCTKDHNLSRYSVDIFYILDIQIF